MMDCPFMSRTSIRLSNDKMTSSASMTALGPEVGPAVYPLAALLSRLLKKYDKQRLPVSNHAG